MKKYSFLLFVIVLLTGCSQSEKFQITGAGATFPYPLYSLMFQHFYQETGLEIEYDPIGSGAGIKRFLKRQVDFGATDIAITTAEAADVQEEIVQIPLCLGAVGISYNLPLAGTLQLTPEIIAAIFQGSIQKWNDEQIMASNSDLQLPDQEIRVIYRADASGTTRIFSDFLSHNVQSWREQIGKVEILSLPVGKSTKGNAGIAEELRRTPGGIAYLERIYATQKGMPLASIQNIHGNFIAPTTESISESARNLSELSNAVSLTGRESENGYPISSFSWIVLYREQAVGKTRLQANNTVRLIWWMLHDGQKYARELDYSPLPLETIIHAEALLKTITYQGDELIGDKF